MAIYKVPQDVEADDKLIGPFSFRQFVYLCIIAACIFIAYWLAQVSIMLTAIPMPIIIFFGALALPLRKDQPMEIYMAALVSFYMKPRRRLWDPDGIDSLIEITAPATSDEPTLKDLSQSEAERRFSYLAEITDSQGWAIRGIGVQAPVAGNNALNSDVYYAAQQVQDVLDEEGRTLQDMNQRLSDSDARHHQEMVDMMNGGPMPSQAKFNYFVPPAEAAFKENTNNKDHVHYNPYPENIHQSVLQPVSTDFADDKAAINTSENSIDAGIISLANNNDLSIEAIAREANRIQEKKDSEGEVVISLR